MKSDQLSFRPGFRLSVANAKSQAAVMVLAVGGQEGGSDNLHKGADQWLYVVVGACPASLVLERLAGLRSALKEVR